jgi:hypothetical protein
MKTLLLSLLFVASAFCQNTTLYSWTFPSLAPHDAAVPVNVTYNNAVSLSNIMFGLAASGVTPTTITSNISSSATSIPVANITGLVVNEGVCFSPSSATCNIVASVTGSGPYSFVLSTGEICQITAITPGSGTTGTLTVVRGNVGTPAAYTSGQAVTFTQYGNNTLFAFSFIGNGWAQVIANPSYGAPTVVTATQAIATALAAIATAAGTH